MGSPVKIPSATGVLPPISLISQGNIPLAPSPISSPDVKPSWYTMLIGYRTIISIAISTILKLLATKGILFEGAEKNADMVTDALLLLASFVADALSIWFKLRAPGPGQLATDKSVQDALIKKAETDATALAAAIANAAAVMQKAQIEAQKSEAVKNIKATK